MTDEEKRVKIAEACGYGPKLERWKYTDHVSGDPSYQNALGRVYLLSELPDYLNSLDAMHEAEKTLSDEDHRILRTHLWQLTTPNQTNGWDLKHNRDYSSATARQRCDAFLLTLP